jgi:flavorubredoxin
VEELDMTETKSSSETRIDEIDAGIYRVNTPFTKLPGGFSFNQYLVVDEEPLLFHAGPHHLFADVRDAVARVIPAQKLRWISFSHHEADESGALAQWLALAPGARPLCSGIAALVGNAEGSGREPRGMADGEAICTGRRTLRWLDAPHVPHGWDCGFLLDVSARVLFCGDLFTQPGLGREATTESDVLGPSEAFRAQIDYWAHAPATRSILEKLAATEPRLLACMHGSAWRGDGARLLRALADAVIG